MEETNLIRCFVAIDLPREIINECERVQNEIKKKNLIVGKFIEGENLHLTLKFLGEIDENRLNEVKLRLKNVKFNKFGAYLGELGVFSPSYIKIIWLHIIERQILELQNQIDEKLADIFSKEERFMSHLTIARVKTVKDKKIFIEELKKIKEKNLKFQVNEFFLIKSELRPEGPVYTILEKYELGEKTLDLKAF